MTHDSLFLGLDPTLIKRPQESRQTLLADLPCIVYTFSLPQIYEEFYHTVNNADHDKDLRLWSNTHGVNMAMNWPQFEVSQPAYQISWK